MNLLKNGELMATILQLIKQMVQLIRFYREVQRETMNGRTDGRSN